MSDISLKLRAEALGKAIENLAPQVEQELNYAVKNLAYAAHASMVAKIQSMNLNPKNRADYLRGLKISNLGNDSYLISLDGDWANKLEEGFPSYDMKETLLKSSKTVGVGPRAGLPWVRTSKEGKKYAAVPFEHKQSFPTSGGDLGKDIGEMFAINAKGQVQQLNKIFKDIDGNPVSGKVATITGAANPNFEGLTKYQHVSPKGNVSSVYMTFRFISENSSGWIHPGFSGYQIFKEAEEYVKNELDSIIQTLIK